MKILNVLALLTLIVLVGCGKDEEAKSETLIQKIDGNHTGTYERIACSFTQSVLFSDESSSLSISEVNDSMMSAELMFTNDGTLNTLNFTGTMSADSTVSINEFEYNDDAYIGNVFLQESGKVKVFLSSNCTIFSNPGITGKFEEN